MDIVLDGDMDGIDATYEIWERFKIPVLYINTISDLETKEKVNKSPGCGSLIKPIQNMELEYTINTIISENQRN